MFPTSAKYKKFFVILQDSFILDSAEKSTENL